MGWTMRFVIYACWLDGRCMVLGGIDRWVVEKEAWMRGWE